MRIPFDSFALAAVVAEIKAFEGAKLQRVLQPGPLTLCLGLYRPGGEAMLLLSADPEFARAHFITKRPPPAETAFGLLQAVRARVEGGRLVEIRQIGFDRILRLRFERHDGEHTLIAELMGKHSNLVLIDERGKILAAAKTVGPEKSRRPIVGGLTYEPPPFPARPSLLRASEGQPLSDFEGASPFLLRWIAANSLAAVQTAVANSKYSPVLSPGNGAYPLSVASLGLVERGRSSFGIALESHVDEALAERERESLRRPLLAQLERVILAREVALRSLAEAKEAASHADRLTLFGELILAYQATLQAEATCLDAHDYTGEPVHIALLPDLNAIQNAQRYFDKAKSAKHRASHTAEQSQRLAADLTALLTMRDQVATATDAERLRDLVEAAKARHWSFTPGAAKKEDRPYLGHRIRELLAPGGWVVLYGENAESNDYLTLRVARSNDWWLHIRGGVSAHVMIRTDNHPERVSREALLFAAKVAAEHSPAKHSGLVAVDYTLKKYVRKPKAAPSGTALYTHEKTLHVERSN